MADRYDVQEPIGEGASAITYRGWDDRLERVVAIKILREDVARDEEYVRRFRLEARAAASVSHGNVVDVYDFGKQDDVLYLVMQFVDGEDLKRLIQREAPLPPQRVRSIIGQVLDGLQAIHAAGIVHRDIKPQNVLIGRDGIARLTDFGVAHVHEETGLTTAGTTVGTAAYMAPEQARGEPVSRAADLYAVGVMLYEMLTGFLPFNGPTAMATMLEHIEREAVPPSQRLPGHGITPVMDSVVMQALGKDPARRFNSARAMKQAIGAAFPGRGGSTTQATIAVPSASPTVRARHIPERHAGPAPYPPQGGAVARPIDRGPIRDEGAGVNGAVKGLLTVILLAVLAGAGWFLFQNLDLDLGSLGGSDSPTATVEQAQPTQTPEPTPTEESEVIAPVDLTGTSEPTPEPTETPAPTIAPTSTPEPTIPPLPTQTPEQGIIEPLDITPFPTDSGQ